MKLSDQEQRKFAAYCRYMTEMEEIALAAKEKLFDMQGIPETFKKEMTKVDKMLVLGYRLVAEDLEKWEDLYNTMQETVKASTLPTIIEHTYYMSVGRYKEGWKSADWWCSGVLADTPEEAISYIAKEWVEWRLVEIKLPISAGQIETETE